VRHRLLSEAVRHAVSVWADKGALAFNIAAPSERSNTVTTVRVQGDGAASRLQEYCNTKCGVVLGTGIGALSGKAFRIAHMGHINAPMVLGTLGVIEIGLNALKIPHGAGGVQAATKYLGDNVPA
jgi:alanine-glyoxylate transaminase/serine-glyoxylate transaminase/serine-pyruvate transaminase